MRIIMKIRFESLELHWSIKLYHNIHNLKCICSWEISCFRKASCRLSARRINTDISGRVKANKKEVEEED